MNEMNDPMYEECHLVKMVGGSCNGRQQYVYKDWNRFYIPSYSDRTFDCYYLTPDRTQAIFFCNVTEEELRKLI